MTDLKHLTPVEKHGGILVKRDDLYAFAGVRGGKVRTCRRLARWASEGLVTAGSRHSPQVNIVAHIAEHLDLRCRVHVPAGPMTPELEDAASVGAELIRHRPGHNSVIVRRALDDAQRLGWRHIPFGMECEEAVEETAAQVGNLPPGKFDRLVVPVGSGMSLAGILTGLHQFSIRVPVIGIMVGADPTRRLGRYTSTLFGWNWMQYLELVKCGLGYHETPTETRLGGLQLDPVYEAKCIPYLRPGDLFWVVGIRRTATAVNPPGPGEGSLVV